MKHSMSSSVCDDSGVAALFPGCWGFEDCTSLFCASVSFQTTTTFWTSFGIELIWKTTSYWQKALTQFIIRFFPSSSKYPTATYKAKSDVFTAVKAAISQILSERRWNHTSNAQKRTCKKDRWENGCSIPVPTATPRDRQPDLPSLHSSSYHFQRPRRCCYPAISTWTPILIGFTDNLGLG